MEELVEISDAEFLKWAGVRPQRWALLPSDRRAGWLDHLVARMQTTSDLELRRAYWKLASVIASADTRHAAEYDTIPAEDLSDH
jgi:hypothetical protein